jgi:hypothetical protein
MTLGSLPDGGINNTLRGYLKSPGRSRLTVRGLGFTPADWKPEWGNIVGEI